MSALTFEIKATLAGGAARVGRVTTPHDTYDTPAFMPVGTQAAVKGLSPQTVAQTGTQVLLANTYHLMLRPGATLIAQMGGLHRWMRWDKPILTDSGGYQVFSLAHINEVQDDGVTFRSHLDGQRITLTPENCMKAQNELGADVVMALDDCPPPAESRPSVAYNRVKHACERSVRWLEQCIAAHERAADQALFGIVQGGTDLDQRRWCVERVCAHDLPGFAIGGVSVGEGYAGLKSVVEHTCSLMPTAKPRYLMGVGYERDILTAVGAGIDMFDCVLPTRNGRNGNAFTPTGQVRLRNARFAQDAAPIDAGCDCSACAGGCSRSYLRHLFMAGEMLGPILVSTHNIRHFQRFMLDIRRAIMENDWPSLTERWPVSGDLA